MIEEFIEKLISAGFHSYSFDETTTLARLKEEGITYITQQGEQYDGATLEQIWSYKDKFFCVPIWYSSRGDDEIYWKGIGEVQLVTKTIEVYE